MSTHNYLDKTGLGQVWEKIKDITLTKNNTTSYTPSGDYNPATKKYVDDKSLMVVEISLAHENGNDVYSSNKTFAEITAHVNNGGDVVCVPTYLDRRKHYILSIMNQSIIRFNYTILNLNNDTEEFLFSCDSITITSNNTVFTNGGIEDASLPHKSNTTPLAPGTASIGTEYAYASGDHVHPTDTTRAAVTDVLTKTNTTSYTPSANYHPATKKYVDDTAAGITSNLSGLTDTTITSPTNGQLLKYNATTSKWENVTLSLAINNGVIQLKEGNTVISSVTLPVYNGGVSS